MRRGKRKQRALLAELRARAIIEAEPTPNQDPYVVVQSVLDGAVSMLRFYQGEADRLKPDEIWRDTLMGPIPHEAIRATKEARAEVFNISVGMIRVGLDERRQRVDEAKVAMLGAAIKAAAEDAGLADADIRRLGAALRERLESMATGEASERQLEAA